MIFQLNFWDWVSLLSLNCINRGKASIIYSKLSSSFNSIYHKQNMKSHQWKQIGFRPKYLCETALHIIIKKWLPNFYSGKLTGCLFIDLSNDIDTFNQHVLLHKLLSFGICNNTLHGLICFWQIEHIVLYGIELSQTNWVIL